MKQKNDQRHAYYGSLKPIRTFWQKVYRRLHNYLASEQTILLKNNPRYQQWDIGEYTYGRPSGSPHIIYLGGDAELKIGKFCSIGDNVVIMPNSSNRLDFVTTYPFNAFLTKQLILKLILVRARLPLVMMFGLVWE